MNSLEDVPEDQLPLVTLAVLVETPTPFMEEFLQTLDSLLYPRNRIHLLLHNAVSSLHIIRILFYQQILVDHSHQGWLWFDLFTMKCCMKRFANLCLVQITLIIVWSSKLEWIDLQFHATFRPFKKNQQLMFDQQQICGWLINLDLKRNSAHLKLY